MPSETATPAAVPAAAAPRAFSPLSWMICWICIATAHTVTGLLCVNISAQVANVSWLFFIPAGISLTTALLWGSKVWPGVFAGELLMTLIAPNSTQHPIVQAIVMATGNGLDAFLAGWWFHDRPGRRIEFDRLRDVIELLAAELLILQPMSALFGILAVALTGSFSREMFLPVFGAWYTANVFAQFVMAPICLVWTQKDRVRRRVRPLELASALVVTLLVGAFGPGRWAPLSLPLPVSFILIFPLLVWCAVRFPSSVAITVGTVLGFFAFDAALAEAGPFAAIPVNERLLYLNGFMAITIATSLFLAAAMGDSVRYESEQERLIADLKDTLRHVERLKELVTFCAWTGRVRWNGQWVSVEQFLRERYQVHVTHGISEEAMSHVLAEAARQKTLESEARPQGPTEPPPPA